MKSWTHVLLKCQFFLSPVYVSLTFDTGCWDWMENVTSVHQMSLDVSPHLGYLTPTPVPPVSYSLLSLSAVIKFTCLLTFQLSLCVTFFFFSITICEKRQICIISTKYIKTIQYYWITLNNK